MLNTQRIVALIAFVALLPFAAFAHEHHHVPRDYPTLQAAINASGPTDEIELDPGVYSGFGFWDLDFQGKSVTIVATEGPGTAIIDLQGTHRFADIPQLTYTYVPHLIYLTFRNGMAGEGGVVRAHSSGVYINSCIFENCHADVGGALSVRDCMFYINFNTFNNCSATTTGGGIYLHNSTGVLQDNTFKNCQAATGGSAFVSGVASDVVFANGIFTASQASQGGAFGADGGTSSLVHCNLVYNSATTRGGAIAGLSGATINVVNSIVHQNTAPADPQIANLGATLNVRHSNVQGGAGPNGCIDEVPQFVDAPNGNYAVPAGSACIDAGENNALPSHIVLDLIENPRTIDGDQNGTATVDIGAIELQVACPADWNNQGGATSQDLFDFLADFFDGDADFDHDGLTNSQDFFNFIAAFFTGC